MTSSSGRQRHADHDANWTKSQDEGHVEATKRDRSPRAGSHAAPLLGTPCYGKWELFDSTDPADHQVAKAICATCPLLVGCMELLAETQRTASTAGGPEGTWAGQYLVSGRNRPPAPCGTERAYQRHRSSREPYDEACRDAHNEHNRRVYRDKKGAA